MVRRKTTRKNARENDSMRIFIIITVLFLTGCANSITFFQSTRSSLTIETSGVDVNKPVQGNFGYKNRTFIYNPKIADDKDVMSLISDAQFNVFDDSKGDEVITFRTALISGEAASSLTISQITEAVKAVTGANIIPSYSDLAKTSKKNLCKLTAIEYSKTKKLITETFFENLSEGEKKSLETNTIAGKKNYNEKLHQELASLLSTNGKC
jgi:hypothetical protein